MVKKMKSLLYVLTLLNGYVMYSQIPQDTILYHQQRGGDLLPYFVINDKTHYEFRGNRRRSEYVVFKDTAQLSFTLPRNFRITSFFVEQNSNKLYMGGNKNYWTLDLDNDSIQPSISIEVDENNIISIIVDGKLYYTDYLSLYIKDIVKNKIIDSINVNIKFQDHLVNSMIKFSNTDNVWLMLADWDGGGISDEQYYVYEEKNKTLKNNNFIKENIPAEIFGVSFYDLLGEYVFLREHILTSNFEIYSKCLPQQHFDIYGLVIAKGEIKQLIFMSRLDSEDGINERDRVLIPFIPDPFKEKTMYEIYENIELKAQDLKRFDAFDLRLLHNMIFAKHNYAFKDTFLQAYFNLYNFYNYNANRLTDVNHLLTPVDRKNLELILQVSNVIKR